MDLRFAALMLQDNRIFSTLLAEHPPRISELTFTNLFTWRASKRYEYALHDGHLLVRFRSGDAVAHLQPIGPDPVRLMELLLRRGLTFERVDAILARRLSAEFEVERQPEMDDYVYAIEDMRELAGRKYAAKRNFIKRFSELEPSVCELDTASVDDFLKHQEEWCAMRNCAGEESLQAENDAIRETLRNHRPLGVFGICVRVVDRIEGFAIGERLNEDTWVEHFEKANTNFIGIHQFLLREFADRLPQACRRINREQDLGIEGMRRAKQSYYPSEMVEKCRIRPRGVGAESETLKAHS